MACAFALAVRVRMHSVFEGRGGRREGLVYWNHTVRTAWRYTFLPMSTRVHIMLSECLKSTRTLLGPHAAHLLDIDK
eukprot:scaffold21588_cov135-Isochrysis_galbana.AAC.8